MENNNQGAVYTQPVAQLPTNRGLIKCILLTIITFGIYGLVMFGKMSDEVNIVCSKYDGKKTMNYWLLILVVTPLTLGIGGIVWYHNICKRMGNEIERRGIDFKFGASTFWLWNVLGLLIGIGPIVFLYKFIKAVNLLNADYNAKG